MLLQLLQIAPSRGAFWYNVEKSLNMEKKITHSLLCHECNEVTEHLVVWIPCGGKLDKREKDVCLNCMTPQGRSLIKRSLRKIVALL